jgi:hypothetical protein
MPHTNDEINAAIRQHLVEEAGDPVPGSQERLRWLMKQTDEYIDRWLGFCALPHLSMHAVRQGDLFATIQVALQLVETEAQVARRADLTASSEWQRLIAAVERIPHSDDKRDAERVAAAFSDVKQQHG